MAIEIPLQKVSFTAHSDLSDSQFCLVKIASNFEVDLATTGSEAIGVLQNKPAQGEVAEVMIYGISKVKVGTGNVNAGEAVVPDSSGRVRAAEGGDYAVGITLEAGNENEYVSILLNAVGYTQ